jgi:hypothetical protein
VNKSISRARSIAFAVFLTLISLFFFFYTARLLYVTSGLRSIRVGGQGAYVGAIVFPVIALACGWGALRCFRAARS